MTALAFRLGRAVSSRSAVSLVYVALATFVTFHLVVLDPAHTTFRIFRQSWWHLLHDTNLYAAYPGEQGAGPADFFKYSPTAALLFAPFAVLPIGLAALLWSLTNGIVLCLALDRLLPSGQARLAQWLLLGESYSAMRSMQSNAVITALIIGGFVAMEHRRQLRAAVAIVTAAALKIYPAAVLVLGVFHPRRLRFALASAVTAAASILLPLLVVTPAMLVQQYRWWFDIERHDASDLGFGLSIMKVARDWLQVGWPNWPMQLIGTVVLLLPLLRRERWADAGFRRDMLASLLAYAVLFNHQAERVSFVIGVTGVLIWYVGSRRGLLRTALMLPCAFGMLTLPLFGAWLAMQFDLWRRPATRRAAASDQPGAGPS
jgi:hypothetical protein